MTHASRGAPRGNHNALKHGFYAQNFAAAETQALKTVPTWNLSEEITLLRLYMRRLVAASPAATAPDQLEQILRTLSLASTAISRLIRAQALVNPASVKGETVADEIGRIAEEVRQELAARGESKRPDPPEPQDPAAFPCRACPLLQICYPQVPPSGQSGSPLKPVRTRRCDGPVDLNRRLPFGCPQPSSCLHPENCPGSEPCRLSKTASFSIPAFIPNRPPG